MNNRIQFKRLYERRYRKFDGYLMDIHHSLIIGIVLLTLLNLKQTLVIIGFLSAFKIGLVRLTQSIDMKPMSECLVPIRLSNIADGEVALVEPVNSLENKAIGLARTVVRSNKGRAMCRVLNPFTCQKHLQSGTVIGKLVPIEENLISAPFEENN